MSFNWINPEDFSFNSFLLMDKWILEYILNIKNQKFQSQLGIALKYNPVVLWYIQEQCPNLRNQIDSLVNYVTTDLKEEEINAAINYVLKERDGFIVYLYPQVMNEVCEYIKMWNQDRLLELTDFTDKVVLDIGSGTGRLTFAAQPYAKMVYAMEPVARLRQYLRDKIKNENIMNVKVLDGFIESLPYEDNTFDIVMSGHVIGDNYDKEIEEITRVLKNGGYIIDCMGEDDRKNEIDQELVIRGFEYFHYHSKTGGEVYRYLKKVIKQKKD